MGSNKRMHTVIEPYCTGCELCIPVCPVDCISMEPVTGERTGWAAWSQHQANEARERYAFHIFRYERNRQENDARLEAKGRAKLADLESLTHNATGDELKRKRAVVEAALARAKARREGTKPA
jgi:electron transport complex protein RnfB